MKKNGFTLAEVLITLTIIGVIATMTLPALMTNTQEQQATTGLKKGITTLTDISQMNQAIDGYDYASIQSNDFGNTDIENNRSLFAMFANRGSIDLQASISGAIPEAENPNGLTAVPGAAPDSIIYFRDGSSVIYNADSSITTNNNAQLAQDGLPVGFTVVFDTNGSRGPNIISNCVGNATGTAVDADTRFDVSDSDQVASDDVTEACTNRTRVIRDRFLVQLRAGQAFPFGAAAQWAYDR